MDDNNKLLNQILLAKENRSLLKKEIVNQKYASLSLTLNIPSYPKSTPEFTLFFNLVLNDLKVYLQARLIDIKEKCNIIDEAGNFFLASLHLSSKSISEIKDICESYEEKHSLGRFIDIDIIDSKGDYISSGKQKQCYYCQEFPALVCVKSKRHTFSELHKFVSDKINLFLHEEKKKSICEKLSSFASRALLYEISLTPKPGLVDKVNSGVHEDMDYYTFLDSTVAISSYFNKIAFKGYFYNANSDDALALIREEGLLMEQEMFNVTDGVNTQKGIIFLMGVAIFTSAHILSKDNCFDIEQFRIVTSSICKNILEEFEHPTQSRTHGYKCMKKYGVEIGGGARFEVANGFPTVLNFSLPLILKYDIESLKGEQKQNVLFDTLCIIMANNNDTNILYRSDEKILKSFQKMSLKTLNSHFEKEKRQNYTQLEAYCNKNKISPGGSADLLAVTIFLNFVIKEYTHAN